MATDTDKTIGRSRRNAVRAAQIILGLTAGAGLAELGFAARDGWAFPHLNIYRADAGYGVLLQPGADAKVRFGGAEATRVRTNAGGFRGPEWGPPAANEVLVVGDSQAFGLGVEESESFSARLGELLGPGTHVSNAAVPTFGPIEMERMLEAQIPARKPKLVVYVVNAYNDFFEANRPNTERHTELDGWAVRKETAIGDEGWFPGRSLLYGRSHVGVAWHRFRRASSQPSALGVPSEGTWKDLLGGAEELRKSEAQVTALRRESLRLSEIELLQAENAYVRAQLQTEAIAERVLPYDRLGTSGNARVNIADARATPGDITDYGWGGEDSRPGPISAEMIRFATEMRKRALAELSARADQGERRAEDIKSALSREEARKQQLDAVKKRPLTLVRGMSPMSRRIARAKQLADQAKAELVVVVVPLDVQVSPKQWAKYGQPAVDMEPSRALGTDVVEAAESMGALGLDLTEALRAVGDDAFLPKDLHLTAKGHAAAAQAIADRVKKGRRVERRLPIGGLPPGRSRAPTLTQWQSVGETLVYGSSARRCVTKRIREWVGVWCTEGDGYLSVPTAAHAVKLVQGGRGEAVIGRWKATFPPGYDGRPRESTRTEVVLVAPVLPEDTLIADFYWPTGKKSRLTIRFPANLEEQTVEFDKKWVEEASTPLDLGPDAAELCECQKKLGGSSSCLGLPAQPSAECRATYGTDCARLVACASGDPRFPPTCPAGQVNAGAMERCTPLCGPGRSCAAGQRCVDWQRGEVCLPEASIPASATIAPPVTEVVDADPPVSEETMALARAVLEVGRRVTASCKLVNAEKENVWFDVHDEGALDAGAVADLDKAVTALEARLAAKPEERGAGLALYARACRLFADWATQAKATKSSRGTLPAFARAAEAWQAYRPGEKVVVYSDAVLTQYREGLRTKGKAASFPLPEWESCKTGPCL